MNAPATTTVEIDSELLTRLRERSPGKSDRELLERVARIQLGFETIRRVQERNGAAGVDDDEVMSQAVAAARESRHSPAAG
jgi:hypothetical protein